MKNALMKSPGRRLAALALTLLMMLSPLASLAVPMPMEGPLLIQLSWTAPDGTPRTADAQPVTYEGYPDSYWLFVEPEAQQQDAQLTVTDLMAQFPGGFSVQPGMPLSALVYQDNASALTLALPIDAYDAQLMPLKTFQLYISLSAPTPEPPLVVPTEAPTEEPIPDAKVNVYYREATTGADVAPMQEKWLTAGVHTVAPEIMVPENHVETNTAPVQVEVTRSGANPSDVVFTYTYVAPTEEPIPDAAVRIH